MKSYSLNKKNNFVIFLNPSQICIIALENLIKKEKNSNGYKDDKRKFINHIKNETF